MEEALVFIRPMKIFHLMTDLDVGGASRQLYKLLACTKDYQERERTLVVSMTDIGPIGDLIRTLGIRVYALGMKHGVPSLRGALKLWQLLRADKPDIVQTWLYHADLLGLLIGKLQVVRGIVWNLRCSNMELHHYRPLSRLTVKILSHLSAYPDGVVVNSYAGRRVHEGLGYHPRSWHVIPNGFDLDEYHPNRSARAALRQTLGLTEQVILIGLIARFDAMKDHQTFLAAARQLMTTHRNVHFLLCGRGVDQNNVKLVGWMKHYGLEKSVHLLGERRDIQKITAALDIASSSSSFGEGFSNAIGEALACEVPCVVTDVGDSAWIVGEAGIVVPPKNPEALAKGWADLIDAGADGRKALGAKGRHRITQHFEIGKIARQYRKLYSSLLSGHACV